MAARKLRNILGLVVTAALASATSGAASSKSRTVIGKRLSVEFPVAPTCEQTEMEAPWGKAYREVCVYFDESIGHGFSAELMALPESYLRAPAIDLLHGAASGAASSTDSDIISSQNFAVGGFPSLDVTLFPRKKGYVAFSRYILAENVLFTITADGYKSRDMPEEVREFFQSARILSGSAPNTSLERTRER